MTSSFINPYTFVPFPEIKDKDGFKHKPHGHHELGRDRYLGEIEVELTARGPLLLRGAIRERAVRPEDGVHLFPRRAFPGSAGLEPYLPGSTLAGVFRSLHELIAGGCLRVFDGDFVPGYRDSARTRDQKTWTLARVETIDAKGRPTSLRLCDTVVWVHADHLARALGGPGRVVTGARVGIDDGAWKKTSLGRLEIDEDADGSAVKTPSRSDGRQWVLLVTHAGARSDRVFFASGRVAAGEQAVVPGVEDAAWKRYEHAVEGTDDVRRARLDGSLLVSELAQLEEDVTLDGHVYGRRHKARPTLLPGQVVWVRKGAPRGPVADLSLSAIWRHAGKHKAADRVPPELLPCEDWAELCPTCRIFGSADTGAETRRRDTRAYLDDEDADVPVSRADAKADQKSYRGHLRFSDARPVEPYVTRVEHLAPLGAPRPGAGQFYLEPTDVPPRQGSEPLREWGSIADGKKKVRWLRGRKQYWLTAEIDDRPLLRVQDRPFEGEMASSAEVVDAGAKFVFTARFENLTEAELGGLFAAFEPGKALGVDGLDAVELGVSVGGGRPFGFGTCVSRILRVSVDTADSRYLADDPPDPDALRARAHAAFKDALDDGVKRPEYVAALTAALQIDRVPPDKVWYPTEKPLQAGLLTKQHLEPGFGFWKDSVGAQEKTQVKPLISLPPVTKKDQRLPLEPPVEEMPQETRRRNGGRRG